jgi:hypothetical protein
LSINPNNGQQFLLTSEGLLYLSEDSGLTLTEVAAPLGSKKVEWSDNVIVVATDSKLYRSSGLGTSFIEMPEFFAGIQDIAASGANMIVLDEKGVHVSSDNGTVFSLLP